MTDPLLKALKDTAAVVPPDYDRPLEKDTLWRQAITNGKRIYADWAKEWGRRKTPDRDHKLTVIVPDTQTPWIDKHALHCITHYIHVNQPEAIIHVGDHFDLYSLGKFRKKVRPNRRTYLDDEVYGHWGGLMVLQILKSAAPKDAEFTLIEGNHEARWAAYAEQFAPELWAISSNLDEELRFKDLGIDYVAPYGEGMWVGKPGGLWATHGDLARKWSSFSAKAHVLEKYGHSVIHGHTHRLGSFFHTIIGENGKRKTLAGFEVGTLADPDTTPRAAKHVDWQQGFAAVYTSYTSPRFDVELISINDGAAITGGKRYGNHHHP